MLKTEMDATDDDNNGNNNDNGNDSDSDSDSDGDANDNEGIEESLADDGNFFCTLAVTGTDPTFQAIFLCNECFLDSSPGDGNQDATAVTTTATTTRTSSAEASEQQQQQQQQQKSPLCVCQACAEVCHDDGYHDVEYVGMGPSYCDCNRLGNCKLYQKSLREAERLGMIIPTAVSSSSKDVVVSSSPPSSTTYIRDSFDIPILQQKGDNEDTNTLANLLVEQARELIRHTKETHWVDETVIGSTNNDNDVAPSPNMLCLLESLAWSIFQSHRERYKNMIVGSDDVGDGDGSSSSHDGKGGAEWWVQVKNISTTSDNNDDDDEDDKHDDDRNKDATFPPLSSSSIDLHYDKDEALAESFGIGSFPTLSTVTYLTAPSASAAPTIVFDHTYTQGEDEVISSMLVSRPRIGKHICFDGRLLHGAPYHPSLLSSSCSVDRKNERTGPQSKEDSNSPREASATTSVFRVTFLVNIWNHRRPANVHALDDKIRESILRLPQPPEPLTVEDDTVLLERGPLPMTPLTIPKVSFEEEEDLPENLQERIQLPFVSNLSEEEDDEDNNEGGGTVVVTFPPPPTDDSVLVMFGPGLQAYLDYKTYGSEDEVSTESHAEADDGAHSSTPTRQSDYV